MIGPPMDTAEGARAAALRRAVGAAVFVFSVGLPSAAKVLRYAGTPGVVIYVAVLGAFVGLAGRFDWGGWAASIAPRRASAVMVMTLLALAMAFVVVYPRVTSGSDRDEALDLATRELSHGRFPYYPRAIATGAVMPAGGGNPISPMPGELLLAAPFVLLGGGAWQTFFWLAAFFYVASAVLESRGAGLGALWSMLVLGPAALHEVMTGGDLLANALWVLVLGTLVVGARKGWCGAIAAIALGVGLSSRAHFLALVPIVFVVLGVREGWRTASLRCALAVAAFAIVTLPFYLHDPAAFSPLHIVGKLGALRPSAPHAVIIAAVLGSAAGAAALARPGAASVGWALATSAIVLGVPVIVAVVLACVRDGAIGLEEYAWYAVSSLPFGVLGAMSLLRRPRLPSITE